MLTLIVLTNGCHAWKTLAQVNELDAEKWLDSRADSTNHTRLKVLLMSAVKIAQHDDEIMSANELRSRRLIGAIGNKAHLNAQSVALSLDDSHIQSQLAEMANHEERCGLHGWSNRKLGPTRGTDTTFGRWWSWSTRWSGSSLGKVASSAWAQR